MFQNSYDLKKCTMPMFPQGHACFFFHPCDRRHLYYTEMLAHCGQRSTVMLLVVVASYSAAFTNQAAPSHFDNSSF